MVRDMAETPVDRVATALQELKVDPEMRAAITTLVGAYAAHQGLPQAQLGSGPGGPGPSLQGGYASADVPAAQDWTDDQVLDTITAAERVQGWAEDLSLSAVRTLTARTAAELLARADAADEEELTSATSRERFRTETRKAVRLELEALTGWTRAGCYERISVATAAPGRAGFARAQLARGATTWARVRAWHYRTTDLDPLQAGEVAQVCLDPTVAGSGGYEVLDPETGEVSRRALSFRQFKAVLEREAVRAEGGQSRAARARRRREVDQRDLLTRMFEHGSAQMCLTGDGPALTAAAARIDTVARRLRAAGDHRSLAQLRADTAVALLGFGQLSTPAAAADPDPIAPAVGDLERMAKVLTGVPDATVELVVPLGVLTGDPGAVAQLGRWGYLTAEHTREVLLGAGAEGTTVHRLLTDPVDGRCIERSVTTYRPDQAMIAQLRAVDGTCRAPGCTTPAASCDLDHERPYDHDLPSRGGPTSEVNLGHKDRPHHWGKTAGLWSTLMDALTRKVTWTSLFGRCYTTDPRDHRALYGSPLRPADTEWDPFGDDDPVASAERTRCTARARARQDRDHHRRALQIEAGFAVRTYDTTALFASRDLLDVINPGQHPEEARELAGTLLYSAVAGAQAQRLTGHRRVHVEETMPVTVAHHRGAQVRNGVPPGHRPFADLLAEVGRPASAPAAPSAPVTSAADEPPPF